VARYKKLYWEDEFKRNLVDPSIQKQARGVLPDVLRKLDGQLPNDLHSYRLSALGGEIWCVDIPGTNLSITYIDRPDGKRHLLTCAQH
jgi:hypothetical protein